MRRATTLAPQIAGVRELNGTAFGYSIGQPNAVEMQLALDMLFFSILLWGQC